MRIGMVVVDLLTAKRVGSERRYAELIHGLRAAGHEVHLFARRWDAEAAAGLSCHRVPAPGPTTLRPVLFALMAQAATARWRGRLDVIHSHAKTLGEDVVSPGGSAHRAWVEVLARDASPWRAAALPWHPYHRSVMMLERVQFARARRVVVNSAWSRRTLVTAYPGTAARVALVHNGVDAAAFSPTAVAPLRAAARAELGLEPGETAFLFLGAGDRRKGLPTLIEAFARLGTTGARLVVVGHRDQRETARVTRAVAQHGLGARIVLRDFVADPRPYYGAADAFVLPTTFDPFSNATAEALACGLPVITTASNGITELMRHGEHGLVLDDPSDAAALAAALERLLDRQERARVGAAGRRLAADLTWQRHVEGMLSVYASVRQATA